ncbi:hypothetical protein [Bartonella queenslandensis]|uniref:hypothetical protein n=1 Tax=Bartonella queenslandensis TaxID=481138 RepID=UPI0002FD5A10|nr:hypothetical protein [Bartonella queenslandensis]
MEAIEHHHLAFMKEWAGIITHTLPALKYCDSAWHLKWFRRGIFIFVHAMNVIIKNEHFIHVY